MTAALIAPCLLGAPKTGFAQWFDNRPTFSRGVPADSAPSNGKPAACPSWVNEPHIEEALRREEPDLRNQLANQLSLSQMMNARSLADRNVLLEKIKGDLASVVFRARDVKSRSPQRFEEANERDRFVREMSQETMATCFPQIANILTEAEEQVVSADRAEAGRQAEARSPAGRLATAYAGYEPVRRCYRARAGRVVAYVTYDDVEDAKRKAQAIEQRLVRENPALNVDALWAEATKPPSTANNLMGFSLDPDVAGRGDVDDGEFTPQGKAYCQGARRRVEDTYAGVFVDEAKPKKDF